MWVRESGTKRAPIACGRALLDPVLAELGSADRSVAVVAEHVGQVLVQRAADIRWSDFDGVMRIGITAGASAPEVLVEEVMGAFAERYVLDVETVSAMEEGVFFPLPRPLREHEPAE